MKTILSTIIDVEIQLELKMIKLETGQSKAFIVNTALKQYLSRYKLAQQQGDIDHVPMGCCDEISR